MPRKSMLFLVVGVTQVMEYTGKKKVRKEGICTIGIGNLVKTRTDTTERLIKVRMKSFGSKSNG